MNVLIIYDAQGGSVEECVKALDSRLSGAVTTHRLGGNLPMPELDAYDEVIIGGAAGFGGLTRALTNYCDRERKKILGKKLGLFLCTTKAGEKGEKYFREFPRDVLDHAAVLGLFGSTGDFDDMNPPHKLVATTAAKHSSGSFKIDKDRIAEFVDKFEAV